MYTINCVGIFPSRQRVNPYGGDVFSTTYLPGRDDYPPPKGHWEVIDTYQSTRYPWEEDHSCHVLTLANRK